MWIGVAGGGYYWLDRQILSTLPQDLSSYRTYRPPTACQVFDRDGTRIDQFYVERRIWVPIDELQPWVWQAFIAAEDRRFMEHQGVDPRGIARALWVNYTAGHDVQGASTLTQQLVKNLIVGKEHSYGRKLKEAVLAYRLEQELSKTEILELYINYIALGSGNYGVEAASEDYFGISARDLDPGQAAMLAGLVPAPSRYSPRVDQDTAARRREIVLGGMVEMGFLTSEQAAGYVDDPVLVPRHTPPDAGVDAAYVTQVRREVRHIFGDEIPFSAGLQVHTPYDRTVQKVADQAIRDALSALETRQGRRGPVRHIEKRDYDAFLKRGNGLATDPATQALVPPSADQCFQVLVGPEANLGDLRTGTLGFRLVSDDRSVLVRDADPAIKPRPLSKVARPGDVLDVCRDRDDAALVHLQERPWGEGAAIVLENDTGEIRAMVGGWNVGLEGFVRATQARRQPGSSFKPYVYGTALLGGHTQLDPVLDAPLSLPGASGVWSPKNYSGGYAGLLPMRTALARSLNSVSVRLILESGVPAVVDTAHRMGVSSPLRPDPTLALGSSEVTPMDQVLGYSTIARMGVRGEPVWIDRVEDVDGDEVGRAGESVVIDGRAVASLPGGPGKRAMPAGVTYELADMMREVVHSGTARRAYVATRDRAGKTGTTNDNVDAWFVGFTPRYTIGVWIGTDGTASLGDGETGGKTALPAWLAILGALPEPDGERFPMPAEAVLAPWQGQWVGLPRGSVPASVLAVAPVRSAPLADFPGASPSR